MLKGLIPLFNLLGIFLLGLFFPAPVVVTQTAPSSAETNNSILVRVSINKGSLTGPAKFTEHLPKGFNAVAIDNEGAKISIDTNTIIFSWDALPTDDNLNVSFRVDITSSAALQNDLLKGKFLYALNGQSSETDCTPSNITVTAGSGSPGRNSVQIQNGSLTPQSGHSFPQQMPVTPGLGGVFVVRQLSSSSLEANGNTTVTLTIHKGAVKGFARIQDSIPPGYTAAPMNSSGASFTFIGNTAKFVWQNIPSDSVITVSYQLSAGADASGMHAVSGNFSYVYNDAPLTFLIAAGTFTSPTPSGNYSVAQNNPASQAQTPASSDNNSSSSGNTSALTNNQPVQAEASTTPTEPETGIKIPQAVKGVTFRVQIMALQKPVKIATILKKKKIKEHAKIEKEDGMTKYTIGNYASYIEVKAKRDELRSKGFNEAFIVSYKSGKRIPLEVALMATHQQQ